VVTDWLQHASLIKGAITSAAEALSPKNINGRAAIHILCYHATQARPQSVGGMSKSPANKGDLEIMS